MVWFSHGLARTHPVGTSGEVMQGKLAHGWTRITRIFYGLVCSW